MLCGRVARFCDCPYPTNKGKIPESVTCRCGEEDCNTMEWQWENSSEADAVIKGPDVVFHPTYSQGTTIIRGDKPLQPGMVHFWEIRIITMLSGTDVMFGIGTDKVCLNQFKNHFISALGTNKETWGFSYKGLKQHNGEQVAYGKQFSQACIIGVCLNLSRGYLEFFLNRQSLGVAYTNIPMDPNTKIYPMVCSTAAQSAIRLINSSSVRDSLELRSFQAVAKQPKLLEELRQMSGLKTMLRYYWFFAPKTRYSNRLKENEIDLGDEAVLSTSRLSRKHKLEDDDCDMTDIYANAYKISNHSRDSGDENFIETDDFFYYLF